MGYSIVNILGGLLIVTSTMVVVSKNIQNSHQTGMRCSLLVLVGLLATLGVTTRCAGAAYVGWICLYHQGRPGPLYSQPRIQEDGRAERRIAPGRP